MDKQYKVIDDRGRLTIPRSVRFLTGITANSIVSLSFSKDDVLYLYSFGDELKEEYLWQLQLQHELIV